MGYSPVSAGALDLKSPDGLSRRYIHAVNGRKKGAAVLCDPFGLAVSSSIFDYDPHLDRTNE